MMIDNTPAFQRMLLALVALLNAHLIATQLEQAIQNQVFGNSDS